MTTDSALAVPTGETEVSGVLGRPPIEALRAIAELAAMLCDTPLASIDVLTETEQHQVATYGFDGGICHREDSLCAVSLGEPSPVIVPDLSLDPRFRDNPFVTGAAASIRFYASHSFEIPGGLAVGTLCVFDVRAREVDEVKLAALSTLSERIVDVLDLALRNRQLALSNERLSAFAGRVSHDLKTPLTGLTLALGLLREQVESGADPASLMRLVDRALAGSDRMASLVDSVLDEAAVGVGAVDFEPVDLTRVITEVREDLDSLLADAEIEVGPLPVVLGDAVQLRRLMQNLCENAAKYRSPERSLRLRISAERHGAMCRLSVADNGRGIPEGDRVRVLEPAVRLHDEGAGSGLGLDTCRRIVEAHGGTIRLTASTNWGEAVGTEVQVDLPD